MISDKNYSLLITIVKSRIALAKQEGKEIKFEDIDGYIDEGVAFANISIDQKTRNRLFADIEYEHKIFHAPGACIFDDYDEHRNWYNEANIENPFFWNRYREHLMMHTSIDRVSINLLDEETLPNIMNLLGNPTEQLSKPQFRRGLIIGDVQSGKTATYSGLICKAADAGYKVVILLAGITESLRRQTQERIDEGIVGLSRYKDGKKTGHRIVGVGLDGHGIRATSFTSLENDFVGDCDKISMTLNSNNSLVIFVVKKNVSILTKLYNWLKELNLDPVINKVTAPMLLIDDEADNASVNTRKDETDPTRTNKIIRQICTLFQNSTYVGFTATPFANVFIAPDSIDSMKNADLFPQHFIYALPTPSSYIGAAKIFYEDGPHYGSLRYISDITEPDYASEEFKEQQREDIDSLNQGPFYYRHKKEWNGVFPDSLTEAIHCYLLANVVRDLRGDQKKPRSMLINMSRFVKVQRRIKEHVESVFEAFFNKVRFDFKDDASYNKTLPFYAYLKSLWDKHFNNISDISFDRIVNKTNLISAIEKIKILIVNGSKTSDKLDYKSNPHLRVIAIGGLALSRGLTLEGLLVSYFYRNTATFDVLMQMGRWFGYRPGYEDLFQIWTSETSARWYEEISRSSEALKQDIRDMYEQHLTPKDFGIKVRYNSSELAITASNKMRKAFDWTIPFTYYGNIYDTPYVSLNESQNRNNLKVISTLAATLKEGGYSFRFADIGRHPQSEINNPNIGTSRYFADVPKSIIVDILSSIKCSVVNMNFNTANLLDFVQDPENIGLDKWDVVFEGGESSEKYDIPELSSINCVERSICMGNRNVIQISSRRRILGLREGKFALTKDQISLAETACREAWIATGESRESANGRDVPLRAYFEYLPHRKPILIVMCIQPKSNKDGNKPDTAEIKKYKEELGNDKIVAFAIGFPGIGEMGAPRKYKVNKVFYQMFMEDSEEIEDEDEE